MERKYFNLRKDVNNLQGSLKEPYKLKIFGRAKND